MGGCSQQEQDSVSLWGGSITQEDGIRVINNPDLPIYGEIELKLEEDLIIGDENDDNTLFYDASQLALDADANIYVLDAGNHRIQKFDSSGNFLMSIGHEGQGPGELDRVSGLRLDHVNHIYTLENMRIQQFAPSGEFLRTIPLTARLTDFSLTAEKSFFGIEIQDTDKGRERFLHFFDPDGKQQKTVAHYDDIKLVQRNMDGARMSFAIRHTYNPVLILTPFLRGRLIYTFTADYSLFVIHEDSRPDIIIRKEEAKRAITQAEKDRTVESVREAISRMNQNWPDDLIEAALQFPVHSPFFTHIVTDDLGRIYTRRIHSQLGETEQEELDIFSPEGYYLYRALLSRRPQLIRNGFLYRIGEDEETGMINVLRFRITNWNELKKEHQEH
jgi:hypothetical protein